MHRIMGWDYGKTSYCAQEIIYSEHSARVFRGVERKPTPKTTPKPEKNP
jgi:hypothetical protein